LDGNGIKGRKEIQDEEYRIGREKGREITINK
jgi:hypothetical protein